LASPCSTAASTVAGIVLRTREGGSASLVTTRAMIACMLAPVKGGAPVSISYVTAASA
jgi:hypothetical protein